MTNTPESLIEKLKSIRPEFDAPELSERAYRQAVNDCIAIIKSMGESGRPETAATCNGQTESDGPRSLPSPSPASDFASEISVKKGVDSSDTPAGDECRKAFEENTRRVALAIGQDPDEALRTKLNGDYTGPVYSAWQGWQDCWGLCKRDPVSLAEVEAKIQPLWIAHSKEVPGIIKAILDAANVRYVE